MQPDIKNTNEKQEQALFQPGRMTPQEWSKNLNSGKYKECKDNLKNLPPDQLSNAESMLDLHAGNRLDLQDTGKPVSPEQYEAGLNKNLTGQIDAYAVKNDIQYQANTLVDDLTDLIDKAIAEATRHRMKKARTWNGFPFISAIQAYRSGERFKSIMKQIEDLYGKLPPEKQEARYKKFLENDKLNPNYGVSHDLKGQKMIVGGAAAAGAGSAMAASSGLGAGLGMVTTSAGSTVLIGGSVATASTLALATGGLALAGIGAVTAVAGLVKKIVANERIYTSIADTDVAIQRLNELKNNVTQLRPGNNSNISGNYNFTSDYQESMRTNLDSPSALSAL